MHALTFSKLAWMSEKTQCGRTGQTLRETNEGRARTAGLVSPMCDLGGEGCKRLPACLPGLPQATAVGCGRLREVCVMCEFLRHRRWCSQLCSFEGCPVFVPGSCREWVRDQSGAELALNRPASVVRGKRNKNKITKI
jgi:hypothetical protein